MNVIKVYQKFSFVNFVTLLLILIVVFSFSLLSVSCGSCFQFQELYVGLLFVTKFG